MEKITLLNKAFVKVKAGESSVMGDTVEAGTLFVGASISKVISLIFIGLFLGVLAIIKATFNVDLLEKMSDAFSTDTE